MWSEEFLKVSLGANTNSQNGNRSHTCSRIFLTLHSCRLRVLIELPDGLGRQLAKCFKWKILPVTYSRPWIFLQFSPNFMIQLDPQGRGTLN